MSATAKPGGKGAKRPAATPWLSLLGGGAVRLFRRANGGWVLAVMSSAGEELHLDVEADDLGQLRELLGQVAA